MGGRKDGQDSEYTQHRICLCEKVSKYLTHFERTRGVWRGAHWLEDPHLLLQRTCVQFPAIMPGAVHPSNSNSRDPGPSYFYKDICFYCVYECFLIRTNVQHKSAQYSEGPQRHQVPQELEISVVFMWVLGIEFESPARTVRVLSSELCLQSSHSQYPHFASSGICTHMHIATYRHV